RRRGSSSPGAGSGADRSSARSLAEEVEVGETREHRLATDGRILERDRDLLVAPGQLGGDDDAVAPAAVTDAVAVAVLALAGDERTGRTGLCSRAAGHRARPTERARRSPGFECIAF